MSPRATSSTYIPCIPCIHTLLMGDGTGPCDFPVHTYFRSSPRASHFPFFSSSRTRIFSGSSDFIFSFMFFSNSLLYHSARSFFFFYPTRVSFFLCSDSYHGVRKPVVCLESDTSMVNVIYMFIEQLCLMKPILQNVLPWQVSLRLCSTCCPLAA